MENDFEPMSVGFWTRVCEVTKERGMTQKELAEKMGLKIRAMQTRFARKGNPELETIAMLSKILGVSYKFLIDGRD